MTYPQKRRTRRRRRTNRSVHRLRSFVASIILGVAGLALGVVGIVGWISPRQEPVQLARGVGVPLQATGLFDPGASVFSSPTATGGAPTAEQLGCVLSGGGEDRPAVVPAADRLGTRVRKGVSLLPALTLGRIRSGERLVCSGTHLDAAAVWVLPTEPSASPAAMSVVVAGVGCIGLSLLANPRARGFTRR